MQGMFARGRIWQMFQMDDNEYGSPVYSGTVISECVASAMQIRQPRMESLEQGLEVNTIADILIQPASLVVEERYEFEITYPPDHPQINERWRITSVQESQLPVSNPRAAIRLIMTRIDESRTVQ